MASPYLLDTTIVVQLARGREVGRRIDAAYALRASPERPFVCSVSLGELEVLTDLWSWPEMLRSLLRELLSNLVVVDIGAPAIASAYAEVHRHLRTSPGGSRTSIGDNDMWIAATARATGTTLLTNDTDFDPLHPTMIRREWIDTRPARPTGKK